MSHVGSQFKVDCLIGQLAPLLNQDFFGQRNGTVGITMDNLLHVELTSEERDILLRGLRFVRSSLLLEQRDPDPEEDRQRACRLDEVHMLSQRLEATGPLPSSV